MANDHPSPDTLAQVAVSGGEEPAHVAGCAACRADLETLRRVVGDLRKMPDPPQRLVDAAKEYFRRRRRLETLIERLVEDTALRAKASTRPEEVLRDAGLEPSPELILAIRNTGRGSTEAARRLAAKGLWL